MNKMKINKGYLAVGLIIAFTLFFELAAHADESDQSTTITFSAPIQVPGQVLPAGTYLLKLASRDSDLNTVQIFNADRTVLYATFETIPTERREPTGNTVIDLAKQGGGQPEALLKWFYPGNSTGHEFVYPKEKEKELAQDQQEAIVAGEHTMRSADRSEAGN
jgi:hypothetical protein